MDEEQKQKWSELGRLEDEFHKRMGKIFSRNEHGNLRIVSLDEVNEVLKLVRQIEEILKELRVS